MKFKGLYQKQKRLALTSMLLISINAFAAGPPVPDELDNSLAIVLVSVAVVLLLAIGMLSYVLITAAALYVERFKEENKVISGSVKTIAVIVFCMPGITSYAADPVAVSSSIGGLSNTSFYTLISVIALELVILLSMLLYLKQLLSKDKESVVAAPHEAAIAQEPSWKIWWDKINSFKPVSEEKDLLLDHDYDGIHELDNRLPPWWIYGFYLTIIVGCIYLYRYHVSGSGALQTEEYQIAMQNAEIQKEEYLKHAANKVDENTVTLITDPAQLGEGKKLFVTNCAACHRADGGGVVGPNLTDDYWLHKGSVKDIFKVLKYGVVEKGMKSWKDDFNPGQLAELASYVKSMRGTNPVNPKEPQGDIYTEETTEKKDTTVLKPQVADNKLAENK